MKKGKLGQSLSWLKGSLKRKLIAMILSVMILMISLVGVFSYYQSSKTIRQDMESYSRQIISQASLNLSRYYKDNEQLFNSIVSSPEFLQWLQVAPDDMYHLNQYLKEVESSFIAPFASYRPEVMSLVFYNEKGSESIYRSGNFSLGVALAPQYTLNQEAWLKEVPLGSMIRFVNMTSRYSSLTGQNVKLPVMTLAQKFLSNGNTGYVMMDISLEPTKEILNAVKLGGHGTAMIADAKGILLAHPDNSRIAQPLPPAMLEHVQGARSGQFFLKDTRQMIFFGTVSDSDWKMLIAVPYDQVARSIYLVRNFTLLTAVLSLSVALMLTLWISNSVTKRILSLRRAIKTTEMGNLETRVPVEGTDEVAGLARTYNHLLERLEQMVNQLAESKLVQQKAVISALQSQINSHFLYNALESINSLANLAGHREIRQTALSLSKLLRYTSHYRDTMVTLKDEAQCLDDYMQIITILYGEMISYSLSLPPSLENAGCMKAILQPLAENSVKHAYEATGERVHIDIRIAEAGANRICVTVADNGPGIEHGKLKELQARLTGTYKEKEFSDLERVGLLNLHYRLKTLYDADQEAGVRIMPAEAGQGARIRITFPYRRVEDR